MKFPFDRRQICLSLCVLPVLGALLSGCGPKIPDTIKIGVAQPLSGPIADLGQDLLDGVILAVEELNAKGFTIDGKPVVIEVVSADDKSDPATGKAVAQQLVDAGVVAVIANLNSGVSIEAAPVYAAHDVAQLAISTNPQYTELGFKTTLRIVANDNLQAKAMGSYAARIPGAARFAVLDDGTTYGKGLADGAAKQLDLLKKETVVRESFDDKTVAFDGLAAQLKSGKVDVIVSMLNDFQAVALLQALQKINYTEVHLLGGDTIKTPTMIKGAGIIKAISATSPVLNATEFPAGAKFTERFIERFNHPVNYGAHYTYDAMYVLAAGIAGARSVDRAEILANLRKQESFAPVTSTMRWDELGEQVYGMVGIYELRDRVWELRSRSDRW